MSIVDRARETAENLAQGGKRQAKRAQLEIKNRQTERRLNGEYARIGKALYPLIQAGDLATDNAEVRSAVAAIETLVREHDERQAEIDRVKGGEKPAAIEQSSTVEQ